MDARPTTTDLVAALADVRRAVRWNDVPDEPGWYCVHVDEDGARDLTAGAGRFLAPGVLYVGEARDQTLQRHLVWHTNIGQFTLRLSLAGLLASQLRLRARTWNVLEENAKERLTRWMRPPRRRRRAAR